MPEVPVTATVVPDDAAANNGPWVPVTELTAGLWRIRGYVRSFVFVSRNGNHKTATYILLDPPIVEIFVYGAWEHATFQRMRGGSLTLTAT